MIKYKDREYATLLGWRAYFHDADGNCIEIVDLRKDWNRHSSAIRSANPIREEPGDAGSMRRKDAS